MLEVFHQHTSSLPQESSLAEGICRETHVVQVSCSVEAESLKPYEMYHFLLCRRVAGNISLTDTHINRDLMRDPGTGREFWQNANNESLR